MSTLYDLTAPRLDGQQQPLADYRGKVLLIVNVASKCGFTPQYAGLEALYERHRARGFEILGFPCNQFGAQEPGGSAEIAQFCSLTYGVSFPMFAKVDVNGPNAHPVFQFVRAHLSDILGSSVKWNWTKFLCDRDGKPSERFSPPTNPLSLRPAIEALLDKKPTAERA